MAPGNKNQSQDKKETVAWYKPVLLGVSAAALITMVTFGLNEVISLRVWKSEVNADRVASKKQDTLCSKNMVSIELLVRQFIEENRTINNRDVMINNLQSAQIEMLAEKTYTSKAINDLKNKYEKLQQELESRAQMKSRKQQIDTFVHYYDTCYSSIKIEKDVKPDTTHFGLPILAIPLISLPLPFKSNFN